MEKKGLSLRRRYLWGLRIEKAGSLRVRYRLGSLAILIKRLKESYLLFRYPIVKIFVVFVVGKGLISK